MILFNLHFKLWFYYWLASLPPHLDGSCKFFSKGNHKSPGDSPRPFLCSMKSRSSQNVGQGNVSVSPLALTWTPSHVPGESQVLPVFGGSPGREGKAKSLLTQSPCVCWIQSLCISGSHRRAVTCFLLPQPNRRRNLLSSFHTHILTCKYHLLEALYVSNTFYWHVGEY